MNQASRDIGVGTFGQDLRSDSQVTFENEELFVPTMISSHIVPPSSRVARQKRNSTGDAIVTEELHLNSPGDSRDQEGAPHQVALVDEAHESTICSFPVFRDVGATPRRLR